MKLGIVGSQNFNRKKLLYQVIDGINEERKITLIISGGAKGADTLAIDYAKDKGIPYKIHKAMWNDLNQPGAVIKQSPYGSYDAYAGIRRNEYIVDDSDRVVAFWDEKSPGTLNTIKRAKKQEKRVTIVKYKLIPEDE